jgi:hypothetical protein
MTCDQNLTKRNNVLMSIGQKNTCYEKKGMFVSDEHLILKKKIL